MSDTRDEVHMGKVLLGFIITVVGLLVVLINFPKILNHDDLETMYACYCLYGVGMWIVGYWIILRAAPKPGGNTSLET